MRRKCFGSYSVSLPSGYYIGIQEYDANSICRFDWGWQTGNIKITTRWDTKYFGIVLRRDDNTVITPSDAPPIQLINTIKTGSWVQGGELGNTETYYTYNLYDTNARIRYSILLSAIPNQQYKITVPSGYCIAVHEYDGDEICLYAPDWMSGTIIYTTYSNTRYLSLTIRRENQQAISPSDLPNITLAPILST